MWHPNGVFAVRINRRWLRVCKPLDLDRSPFPIIFNLHGGQKFTPLLMGYGTIVLMFILQLILHEFRESILSGNLNNVFVKLFVACGPICLLKPSALHRRWRWLFGQVVNIVDTISELDNSDPGGFHNVIVNIFYVVLEGSLVPLPHVLTQLEPNISIKVNASITSQLHIPWAVISISLCLSPDFLHSNNLCWSQRPLIPK